jgi:HEAT repeat protein
MKRSVCMVLLVLVMGCSQRTTDDWLKQLKDSEVPLHREAIRELGTRTDEAGRIVPAFTEALRDQNHYVRHDLAITLGKFGKEARGAIPALKALLKDKEPSVRQGAANSLKKISAADALSDRDR